MTIPLDPRFIPAFSIEDVLLDKDTGAPLSGGLVYFEQDNQRGTLKPIYQITGTSPNYIFTRLPNPMTLSSIGTFVDALENPVIPYFYPYTDIGSIELYYIRVTSSGGVPQFDREAQPYVNVSQANEILSVITNELSNPQFIEVLFDTSSDSYTYNVNTVSDNVISIAPDWDLIVSAPGVGSVTVKQLKPQGLLNIVTNPGTLLTISSAGLSKLQLRQRIFGSPNLWGSGYLAGSFVAKTYSGTAVTLNMYYSQSNGMIMNQQFLPAASLPDTGAYQSFSSSVFIDVSSSTQTYPSAYVDIYFDIPLSIKIDITSVMVAFTGLTNINDINYDQESNARQIDHLYHDAYPIVPIGTVIDFFGFATPLHYYFCDGAAKNRISDFKLFSAMTTTETVNLTNTGTTFTVVDDTKYAVGMKIEGTGLNAAGATITSIVTGTITFTPAATATVSSKVTFFVAGNGDGSTTFNVPDLRGYTTAGSGLTSGFTLFASVGVGGKGGEPTHILTIPEMPSHNHPLSTLQDGSGGGGGVHPRAQDLTFTNQAILDITPQGGDQPHNNIQPTTLARKCIRYQ